MKGGIITPPIQLGSNKIISTQYDYSPSFINYHSEINKDICYDGPCNAEKDAMMAEEERDSRNKYLQWEYQRNMKKYKDNNKKFRAKKEEEKDIEKIKTMENMKKKETSSNYNETIRQTNLKRMNSRDHSQDKKMKSNSKDKIKGKMVIKNNKKNIKTISDNDKEITKTEEEMIIKTYDIQNDDENKNTMIDNKLKEEEDKVKEPNIVIDIRTTIDQVLNQQLKTKKTKAIQAILNKNEEDNNIYQNITTNLKQLSSFRSKGSFSSLTTPSNYNKTSPIFSQQKQQDQHHQNLLPTKQSKLQKQRYNLALKKILIERLGARNIQIPNICSCGQLQKNLDTLLYVRNTSIYSVFKSTCANNCMYYNKRNEFEKSIHDIISSIRDLTFETFNNKY